MILERCTQKIISTNKEAFALEKKFDALEAKVGNVPVKRRYMPGYSGHMANTFIWERDWPSMAALESYNEKISKDPEWAEVFEEARGVFAEIKFELFRIITLR